MALTTPRGQPSDTPLAPFEGASAPNVIGYRFNNLDPASNIYIQRDDKLVIQSLTVISNEVLNVNIRLLQPGRPSGRTQPDAATVDNPLGDSPYGVIVPINVQVAAPSINASFTKVIDLAEGYLMSVGISSTQAQANGETFVRAFILRGSASVANCSYLLTAGYVTQLTSASWPYGVVRSPLDGAGFLTQFSIANPAAGADWTLTIAAPFRSLIRMATATLITSATVANRIVTAHIHSPGGDPGVFPPNQSIPANTTASVTFSSGVPGTAVTPTIVNVQLPQPTTLQSAAVWNQQLVITTLNIQPGDQWQGINGTIEQWMDL